MSMIKQIANTRYPRYAKNIKRNYRNSIGNTPLVRIGDSRIYMKMEGHNPSGSIKDRPINNMMDNICDSELNNNTVCLVTSGSAGMSLYKLHNVIKENNELNIDSLVVMPKRYASKCIPEKLIQMRDVKIHRSFDSVLKSQSKGTTQSFHVLLLDETFINTLQATTTFVSPKKWILLDQHHNLHCMDSHEKTASEIISKLPETTDVICTTGTGGTVSGLIKYLPDRVRVHARTCVSGEIEGLGDVGRYNNYCDTSTIEGYYECNYKLNDAIRFQEKLNKDYKIKAGQSTGASLWLANQIMGQGKNLKIVVISPDGILSENSEVTKL